MLNNDIIDLEKVIGTHSLKDLLPVLSNDALIQISIKKVIQEQDWEIIHEYLKRVDIYSLSSAELITVLTRLVAIAPKIKGVTSAADIPFRFNDFTLE